MQVTAIEAAAIERFTLHVTVPIFLEVGDSGRLLATGTLFKVDDRSFLITARHIFDNLSDLTRLCSDWVIQNVLPLLQGGECRLTEAALAVRLKEWVESLGDREVIFRSDNPGHDWPWVEQLFTFYGCWPKNMRRKYGAIYFNHDYLIRRYQDALAEYWREHSARQHHALIDARSLLYGWRKAIKRGI
jgi:hypothetical protein